MKYLYIASIALFLYIFPQKIQAQEPATDSTEINEEPEGSLDDVIPLTDCNDSPSAPSVLFDTLSVPSATLYKSWNNYFVNPYDTDFVKKPDTTLIDLKGYCHPRSNYLTSDFGFRRWRHHYGVDIKVQVGDSILCSFDGMVRICKYSRSYGNYVVVRHYNGLETVYAHLKKSLVTVNQKVKAGEALGLGGNTGRSTGPHLHYEVRYLGQCINPHDIIDFENFCLKNEFLKLCAANYAYLEEIRKIRYHIVRSGDTLYKIARRYGVTVDRLCKLNKMRKSKLLRVGQRVRYT